jgi:hypothetical protein
VCYTILRSGGGGLEYLRRNLLVVRGKREGNPVAGGITGPPWSSGPYKYGDLALQVGDIEHCSVKKCSYSEKGNSN